MDNIEKAFKSIMKHRSEDTQKEEKEETEEEIKKVHKLAKDLSTTIAREKNKQDPQGIEETMRDHIKKLEKSLNI